MEQKLSYQAVSLSVELRAVLNADECLSIARLPTQPGTAGRAGQLLRLPDPAGEQSENAMWCSAIPLPLIGAVHAADDLWSGATAPL